jgi:hypothetical protein
MLTGLANHDWPVPVKNETTITAKRPSAARSCRSASSGSASPGCSERLCDQSAPPESALRRTPFRATRLPISQARRSNEILHSVSPLAGHLLPKLRKGRSRTTALFSRPDMLPTVSDPGANLPKQRARGIRLQCVIRLVPDQVLRTALLFLTEASSPVRR